MEEQVVEYRGSVSEQEFVAATRLRRRILPEGGSAADSLLWFGIGFAALALWGYVSTPERVPGALWWIPFSALCLAMWWRRRSALLGLWRASVSPGSEQRGTVTEQWLEARLFGVEARIPWKVFAGRLASGRALVLFVGTHLQLVLGASQFADENAWREACALVARHVPMPERPSILRRTILWLILLLVIFLAWHFAQMKR